MKQLISKAILVWCCLLLVFSLTVPTFASSSRYTKGKEIFKLPDGREVTLENEPERLVMMEDKDRHFRRLSLQTSDKTRPLGESNKKWGEQQDSPGNLFGKEAEKMLPGDQAHSYLYIDSVETNFSKVPLEENETLIAQGGLVYLITRLPDSAAERGRETDTFGVEAYNEDLISEELLHRSLINVHSEIYLNSEDTDHLLVRENDPFWDIEKYQTENPTTMRADGCPFGKSDMESFHDVHEKDKKFESEPIFMGFVSSEYGVVSTIRVKAPLDLDNRFDKVQGRVIWEFYYVPGNIIEKSYKPLYEEGTDIPDKDKNIFFIPDESPAKSGPNIVVLGNKDPLGNLPQTGGGLESTFKFSTFQTVLIFVGIMFLGFLLLDFVGVGKKNKKQEKQSKREEP